MNYFLRYTPACLVAITVGTLSLSFTQAQAQSVFFDFVNNGQTGDFDSALAGATMTRDDGGSSVITITSVEVRAPNYVSGVWDGTYNTISTTNIPSSNALAIDNKGDNPPFSNDSSGLDPGEAWTLSFDVPVIFNQIEFSSFTGGSSGDKGRITVDGITTFDFDDSDLGGSDELDDPFGVGTIIPAGTNITFEGLEQVAGEINSSDPVSRWRIDSFTVTEVVEEPLTLYVDRNTGAMTLKNTFGADVTLVGYEIDSSIGALDTTNWTTISGTRDDSANGGDETIDPNDVWTVLTDTAVPYSNDLSEFAFGGPGQGSDGATLAPDQEVSLGLGWVPTPNEDDLVGTFVDIDGNEIEIVVEYVGNGDQPLMRSDLDHDGDVDVNDWVIFNANDLSLDLSALGQAAAYNLGDLDGDFDIDAVDFRIFKIDFDAAQGEGAFLAMIQNVPEPSSYLFLLAALPALVGYRLLRLQPQRSAVARLLLVAVAMIAVSTSVHAVPIEFVFENNSELDDEAPIGTIMTRNDGSFFNPITLTLTDARAPMYTNPSGTALEWDGTSYFTVGSGIHSASGLIINNPGSGNDPSTGGLSPIGDTGGINEDEILSFQFDRTVVVHEINFSSITIEEGDQAQVDVDGLTSPPLVFNSLNLDEDSDAQDPFTGLVIPAGTDITFEGLASNSGGNSIFRVVGITVEEYLPLEDRLKALVNTTTGEVTLTNPSSEPLPFNSYEIRSTDDALKTGDGLWSSLDDQDYDTIGAGIGESWDEGGAASASFVGERFLLGSSTLDAGESVSLGNLFDTSIGDINNLSLFYTDPLGHGLDGVIEMFTPPAGLPGDFNDDGTVDAADYVVWRNNLGGSETALNGNGDDSGTVDVGDYSTWKSNFGASAPGALAGVASQVPEPGSVGLAMLLCAGTLAHVRHNSRRHLRN